ncbi:MULTISPECIES: NAD(P)-dependent oxidoreductase [unclassified Aureimonas]|uniref:NAD(P)-dependent oxidoreductase n=1 Tax=unclassified Aureimonas TaxID=2615206 RepID=UPI0006FA8230|nr:MULTISPECIES: NAD(P)-dependent oxidoreductase [unclassified Aureimonas]KQT52768.1 3-hydroxyisobutyrate dehydrogenase [Aureimonas sp. Leaf427]KQT80227.1 3-hydroxyisobutyrate dehydrogenase [Aureimonas sp. Leaf460]
MSAGNGKGETVGFIGLGYMGHGMAKNIVEKGYALHALANRRREAIEDLVGRGAVEAASVAEIAGACDVVVLCLPGSPEVEAVVAGPDGLLANARPGLVIIDTSTANPVSTRRLYDLAAEKGVAFVDAPLGRTPKEAWAGELDSMVGAEPDVFERVKPIVGTWSGRIIHTGGPGAGHTMKLLNNFLSLGYAALYAEALAIGEKAGVSAETFHGVIAGGRMDCGFYQTFMGYVVGRDPEAHKFSIRNAHKDMRYLVGMANEAGVASHVSSAVKNSYATADGIGRGGDFVPFLADIVAEQNGLPKRS